jgi:hypothetical protein
MSAALDAPVDPIAIVPTGKPRGIWTIEYKLSTPDKACVCIGTPMIGIRVFDAIMPGK